MVEMAKNKKSIPQEAPAPQVIMRGDPPPCLKKGNQCRGCFGWQNMLHAAESSIEWRGYPISCEITGLTIKF